MAASIDEHAPCLEERLLSATNTSNMRLDPNRSGTQADLVAASGMVRNQIGMALVHLQGAWDVCDKPAKRTPAEIARRAAEIPDKKGRPDMRRAAIEAMVWHATAMRETAAKLPGRSVVMGLLQQWAALRGVDQDLLSPAIFHWLSPKCPACDGTGKKPKLFGSTSETQSCEQCKGATEWPRPLGAADIHEHIKKCMRQAKGQLGAAFYG